MEAMSMKMRLYITLAITIPATLLLILYINRPANNHSDSSGRTASEMTYARPAPSGLAYKTLKPFPSFTRVPDGLLKGSAPNLVSNVVFAEQRVLGIRLPSEPTLLSLGYDGDSDPDNEKYIIAEKLLSTERSDWSRKKQDLAKQKQAARRDLDEAEQILFAELGPDRWRNEYMRWRLAERITMFLLEVGYSPDELAANAEFVADLWVNRKKFDESFETLRGHLGNIALGNENIVRQLRVELDGERRFPREDLARRETN